MTVRLQSVRRTRGLPCAAFVLTAAFSACGGSDNDSARTAADSQAAHVAEVAAAGGVVDSILPMAEQLRRFREGMTAPDGLRSAEGSRDALAARWLRAIAESDTTTLNALLLDRAEFAYLYFPSSPMATPPYEAPPQLLWGQILASSNDGLPKMLRRFAGKSLSAPTLSCPDSGVVEGENRTWSRCELSFRVNGAETVRGRFFGTIVERGGRFKFLGYANEL
ncbi:MAG: hypothetical protein C0516_06715 [Gemmatimonas sp.]|jgi:hypothetical protein|uniref:hypothetical protein n=1 Tax=Gemmatimonas sp. UBA7669 TaxID=1946568 RepID=UPI0025BBB18A|nr:hypothetical protein [Gemmatimonas sp. UBA7669]MBA3918260.1 hypothetical protein [Gemmatimonas sp.]